MIISYYYNNKEIAIKYMTTKKNMVFKYLTKNIVFLKSTRVNLTYLLLFIFITKKLISLFYIIWYLVSYITFDLLIKMHVVRLTHECININEKS